MKIFKYPLKLDSFQRIHLPLHHQILSIKEQNDILCLWALVHPEMEISYPIDIRIVGTGHEVSDSELEGFSFFDTIVMKNMPLVWHVFINEFSEGE